MFNRSDIKSDLQEKGKQINGTVDQRGVCTIGASVFTEREPERRLLGRNRSLLARSS